MTVVATRPKRPYDLLVLRAHGADMTGTAGHITIVHKIQHPHDQQP